MPIAKEDLRDGFVLVAKKGTFVSPSTVDTFGWADKVDADDTKTDDAEPRREDPQPQPQEPQPENQPQTSGRHRPGQ